MSTVSAINVYAGMDGDQDNAHLQVTVSKEVAYATNPDKSKMERAPITDVQ